MCYSQFKDKSIICSGQKFLTTRLRERECVCERERERERERENETEGTAFHKNPSLLHDIGSIAARFY